jgi:hypothetical protein
MSKRNLVIVVIAFLLIISCYFFGLLPLVSESSDDVIVEEVNLNKGDLFNPFSEFNFNDENFQLYYIQSAEEQGGLFKVLYTDEKETLLKIQKSFNCTYTGGDIATYESKLILVKDNKIVLKTYIGLKGQPYGLQNSEFGWLTFKEREKASEMIKGMKNYLMPFLSI